MASTATQKYPLSEVALTIVSNESESPSNTNTSSASQPQNDIFHGHSSSEPFLKRLVRKRLPILGWLPAYKKTYLVPDAISGISVGLTAIPQSIAYANIAGLSPEFGLYSSFVSCFVYLFLGSCRQMTIGPTAVMELLVFETCGQDFPSCVVLTGFYVGLIQLIMGFLKLGAIVSLISDPVTIGFVGGAALTIASSQIKSFLGLSGRKGNGFVGYCKTAFENISSARLGDSLLGISCVVALLILKSLKDYVKHLPTSPLGKFSGKLLWLLSIGRNALVVITVSVFAALMKDPPFALTGNVKSGFPPVQLPQFGLPPFQPHNNMSSGEGAGINVFYESSDNFANGTLTFFQTLSELRTGPLTIAVISILQNVAIAKAFGSGQSIDATQEMIALGISHVFASFFSSMPTAGSFSRSAVNESSGVKSPIGGVFTGLLVMFALSFLTRWFAFIPKASLAAVILCAVLPMIEYEAIMPMWKVSKLDVLTTMVTFLASLTLGMEYGIIIGVGTSLGFFLVRPVRPQIAWSIGSIFDSDGISPDKGIDNHSTVLTTGNSSFASFKLTPMSNTFHLVKPEQGFSFPSVDAIRTMINKLALKYPDIKIIALDCENMITLDYTSASALASLSKSLRKTGKVLVFIRCPQEWQKRLHAVGLEKPEYFDNVTELEKSFIKKGWGGSKKI